MCPSPHIPAQWPTMGTVGDNGVGSVPQLLCSCPSTASRGGHWGAWMPSSISAFEGTCVSIPCRFDFPDELRPAVVHGVWYFNSPYPKNYPPVVFKSRTQVVHESFQGRSRLLGDLGLRNCTLLLSTLSPELGGKYYFRGDLGGYNQYTFSEHSVLDIISKSGPPGLGGLQGATAMLRGRGRWVSSAPGPPARCNPQCPRERYG